MTESVTVKQGDSVALSYSTKPKQDMSTWTCQVQVRENTGGAALIDITLIAESADTFSKIGLLDTTTLPPGSYYIYAQLDNAGTSESKEIHSSLIVEAQGVY